MGAWYRRGMVHHKRADGALALGLKAHLRCDDVGFVKVMEKENTNMFISLLALYVHWRLHGVGGEKCGKKTNL